MIEHPTTLDIDFLPASYREQGVKRKTGVWRLLVIVLFGLALVGSDTYRRHLKFEAQAQAAQVETLYPAAVACNKELAELQKSLAEAETTAELITYLRHPWPRSQIVALIARTLPDAIILRELQLFRENVPQPTASAVPAGSTAPTTSPPPSGAAIDLAQLRSQADGSRLVVLLVGTTSDAGSLHEYLGQLARRRLFQTVRLGSIETAPGGGPALFTARLTIRSLFDQSGSPDAKDNLAHTVARPEQGG